MFKSISDAKTFLFNHGFFDFINLELFNEIVEDLFRNADDLYSADSIVEKYLI